MSRHTTYTVLDFIADDEFVMEGSDDELEDYVYDDSSNRDENIDQPATPLFPLFLCPFPLLHDSPLSSQIVNSPLPSSPSSPLNLLATITAERDKDAHQVHALQLAATVTKKGISRCWLCMNKQKRKETYWYCQECKIHLCHTGAPDTDCFYKIISQTDIIATCFKTCFCIYLCFLIM